MIKNKQGTVMNLLQRKKYFELAGLTKRLFYIKAILLHSRYKNKKGSTYHKC